VDVALAALRAAGAVTAEEAASWDFRAASDFAGRVEELSRWVEYQQLVAAGPGDPGSVDDGTPEPLRSPGFRPLNRPAPLLVSRIPGCIVDYRCISFAIFQRRA
jgi:hypothetical protein